MAEWQWKRWDVLQRVIGGTLTMAQASEILRLSVRQVRRLRRRAERDGRQAVVHGNRGRSPAHRLDEATRTRILTLLETSYRGGHFHWPLKRTESLAGNTDPRRG